MEKLRTCPHCKIKFDKGDRTVGSRYCEDCYAVILKYEIAIGKIKRSVYVDNCFVYFAKHPTEARIKIGYTQNVKERISILNWYEKADCSYIAFQSGGKKQEAYLHGLFDHIRISEKQPSGYEWFRDVPEIRMYIDTFAFTQQQVEMQLYHLASEKLSPLYKDTPDEWKYLFSRHVNHIPDEPSIPFKSIWHATGGINLDELMSDKTLSEILAA